MAISSSFSFSSLSFALACGFKLASIRQERGGGYVGSPSAAISGAGPNDEKSTRGKWPTPYNGPIGCAASRTIFGSPVVRAAIPLCARCAPGARPRPARIDGPLKPLLHSAVLLTSCNSRLPPPPPPPPVSLSSSSPHARRFWAGERLKELVEEDSYHNLRQKVGIIAGKHSVAESAFCS